jgi:16S rRNA (guanine(966)-N(2))-methyltransferase RsmD
VWLDLFAGTGAVGLEALSRGARMVYFVESSHRAAAVIRNNLQTLGVVGGFEILDREAVQALRVLNAAGAVCDYCYLDPPYRRTEQYVEVLTRLAELPLLTAGSIVCAEHDKRFDPGERFGALQRYRRLQQGDASLSFYRPAPAGTVAAVSEGD